MYIVFLGIYNLKNLKNKGGTDMTTTKEIATHAIVEHITIKNCPLLEPDYYLKLALFYAEKGYEVNSIEYNCNY